MKMKGWRWFLLSLIFILITTFMLTGWGNQAQSQPKYPNKSIDIVVAFTPGGSSDSISRIIAAYLQNKWGVPVNVINKPGGNTVPACLEVYKAAPDGYTLLADGFPTSSMLPTVVKDLPFKVMDRTFIAILYCSPTVFFVPPSTPFKNIKDLFDEAKKNPGNFTWGSLGGVGGGDYIFRLIFRTIGVDISKTKPVMAPGGAGAVTLAAGGNILLGSSTVVAALSAIKGGMVRPIAVTSLTRWPDLPDVPTLEEAGYPELSWLYWGGISGPPGLPSYVADSLGKTIEEILKEPEIISKLKNVGCQPYYHNASKMRERVTKEIEEVKALWGVK